MFAFFFEPKSILQVFKVVRGNLIHIPSMVRKYVRKEGGRTRHLNVDPQRLEKAVNEVKTGKSSYIVASQRWGIDKMKIFRTLKKTHQRPIGRPPIITSAEEEMFKKHLCTAAEWGFPWTWSTSVSS